MKRIVLIAPLVLMVAACGGGPRPSSAPYFPPPPPPPRTATPPQAPQTANRVTVPQHVASAGPLKSAMVSTYADNQERDMRQGLRAFGINIARRGDGMVLNINNAVLFDGMALSVSGENLLAKLAILLRRYDHTAVNVSGHTDTTGSPEQNMTVSQKRAQLVAAALAKDGVAGARLSAQGFGESSLKIRTGDDKAEPRNRRIEIRVTPTPMG